MEIEPERFRSQIEALLRALGLPGCVLLIVPSVQDWANARGHEETNDRRAAMVELPNGPIVLLSRITPEIQRGIMGRLAFGGSDVEQLHEPEAFLEHLVLHEAAHLVLPNHPDDDTCDQWPFEHLAGRIRPD